LGRRSCSGSQIRESAHRSLQADVEKDVRFVYDVTR